ncbi:MAG: DNA polymerase IV [Candidatus Rokuibacteriota bacterium]|nr:MAG: DNA polymerase IV [Candidatus Rokubacteria bacterium]
MRHDDHLEARAGRRDSDGGYHPALGYASPVRIIAHVDMDAFYASVEARYDPALRDKPVVVGADPKEGRGRGVVEAASYPARRYGIRAAMPISRAWKLSEAARRRGEEPVIFVHGHRQLYVEMSARVMAILAPAGDAFEEASIDEAYLDLSSLGSLEAAVERARALKREIAEREGLTCSVGLGPNKLVAKIASDFKKPDGLTVVAPDQVQAFLDPMSIRVIPGIGPKTEAELNERNIRTVRDLRGLEVAQLSEWFGRWGEDLHAKARGLSDSVVSNEWEPKSVGEQETFEVNTLDADFILQRVRALAAEVFGRLQRQGFRACRTVTITVRFAHFRTLTRSHTSRDEIASEEALYAGAAQLLAPFFDARENPRGTKIRLIGVRAEKLQR